MPVILSIILSHRNNKYLLSRTLESILNQSLKDLEVVLVDDRSDDSCADIAEAFLHKGLTVILVTSQERLYTKNTRLLGLKHAKGEIVTFADAGDIFWGAENLEHYVDLYRATDADILQFRCIYIDKNTRYAGMYPVQPLAEKLIGQDIFDSHLDSAIPDMWGHLYARQIWLNLIPYVYPISIKNHFENICLLLFYYHNANTYISSDIIGYSHRIKPQTAPFLAAIENTKASLELLEIFPNYLSKQNAKYTTIQKATTILHNILHIQFGRASIAYLQSAEALDLLSAEDASTVLTAATAGLAANAQKLREIHNIIYTLPCGKPR